MRFHEEAARDAYDAIVVGGGLGGPTAAALLARAGQSVFVLERHDRPGGYAHAFRRRGYRFDSAVHVVGGCEPCPFEGGAYEQKIPQSYLELLDMLNHKWIEDNKEYRVLSIQTDGHNIVRSK